MYISEINKFLDSLRSNKTIDVLIDEVGTGLDHGEIKRIFKKKGIQFNKALAEFYNECNGIQIEWEVDLIHNKQIQKFEKDDEIIQGNVLIPSLQELLEKEEDSYINKWKVKLTENAREDMQNLRCIDYGWIDRVIGFIINGDVICENDIYYLFHDDDDFGLRQKSFSEYILTCISYKGIYLWESIFLYGKELTGHTKMIEHYLHQLFPKNKTNN
jgi:hypothetical protein